MHMLIKRLLRCKPPALPVFLAALLAVGLSSCSPAKPAAEWVETQASWFRSQRTAAGDWLAAEIQELADLARALHAATPEQFSDRRNTLSRDGEWYDALPPIDCDR